ncbi:MAG: adenylyltransferase/cytidyltransferase family protein, partial [Planctomycetes bacterium]|nr:adenylyltransferase/cytidyltransferase family protein [Planctomycetota bacterium]
MKFSAGEKFFLDPYQLRDVLDQHRERGEKIVFANGCFELLHVGHIRYLRGAKALGQVLVVAVNTDASMKIIKPERQPPNPDTERYEILAALEMVDYV